MIFEETKKIYKQLKQGIRPFLLLNKDKGINASINLFIIKINQGALEAYDKDELALCISHELGHWLNLDIFRWFKNSHEKEFDADVRGAALARKAGFDVVKGCERFYKLKQEETKSHPHPMKRRENLLRIYK